MRKEEYLLKRLYHRILDKTFHPKFKGKNGLANRVADAFLHSLAYKDKNKALKNTVKYTVKGLKKRRN
jgi:hypothetical protein